MLGEHAPRRAQVGHPPAKSPYLDLEHTQELTLIGGQFHAHRDPADVAPQGGLLVGAHYEWRAGGPAHLTGEFVAHLVGRAADQSVRGRRRRATSARRAARCTPAMSDSGSSLTGAKSWHHIVPEVAGGVGLHLRFPQRRPILAGSSSAPALHSTGAAEFACVPGGKWQVRGDIKNRALHHRVSRGVLRRAGGRNGRRSADAGEVVLDEQSGVHPRPVALVLAAACAPRAEGHGRNG